MEQKFDFELPLKTGFTIYSKSGCLNCSKVKELLKNEKMAFHIIDCDEYIIEEKDKFLAFIKKLTEKDCKIFPMVFLDEKFIGNYNETICEIEKLKCFFEENISF
jgi:glutaredoxin